MYKKSEFGKRLADEVNKNYNVTDLAGWAHGIYLDNARYLDAETRSAIMTVIAMDEGDEFVLSKEELLKLASDLQKDS